MSAPLLGQLLALLSAASFAMANIFISRTSESRGDRGVMFSVLMTMAISALLWLVLEGGSLGDAGSRAGLFGIAWFAAAGVFAMVFGRSLVFESIRRLGVTRSAAVKRLNPFFSVLLAATVLSEPLTRSDGGGMALIAVAFILLIRESFRNRSNGLAGDPPPVAYLFGVFGALSYAFAYVIRKLGLEVLPSPAFGTFISAVSGFAVFALLSLVLPRYRAYFRGIFAHLDRWIVVAAVMVSLGQILLFAALALESVSTVVMIASLEIFISMFLSIIIFRSERMPGVPVLAAAALAALGVILVAAG